MLPYLVSLCLAKSIDLTMEATVIPNLLPSIERVTGKKLTYGEELQDDVLIISVKGVSSDELLDRIATTASAKWIELEDGKLKLSRSRAIDAKQREEWAARRLEQIRTAVRAFQQNALPEERAWTDSDASALLAKMKDARVSEPPREANQMQLRRSLHDKMPISRLFARLFNEIDIAPLAAMTTSERRVYCSKPTSAQLAFGKGVRQALSRYVDEHNILARATQGMTIPPYVPQEAGIANPAFLSETLASAPAEIRLIGRDRGAEWLLKLFASDGTPIATMGVSLYVKREDPPIHVTMRQLTGKRSVVDEESVAFETAIHGYADGRTSKWQPASGDVRKKLLSPETHDPLSFGASALFLQLAAETKSNLVMDVPDYFIYSTPTLGSFINRARMRVERGWLLAKPCDYGDRTYRLSRRLLGRTVRDVDRQGAGTLDNFAEIVLAGLGSSNGVTRSIVDAYVAGIGAPQLSPSGSQIGCEIYRSLSNESRQRLLNGGTIPLSSLPPSTQKAIHQLAVFGEHSQFQWSNDASAPPQKGAEWFAESSQVWPSSIPSDAALSMFTTTSKEYINLDAKPISTISEGNLAAAMVRTSAGADPFQIYSSQDRLKPCTDQGYIFKLSAGNATLTSSVGGLVVSPEAKAHKFSELPAEDRKRIEEISQRLRAASGGGGYNY
ncbi:MAG: hypothetical protein ABL949_15580 [Fimbriimonadaceae bacterium]